MNKPLHITVGAAPHGKLDLTGELQLVKAAMLYADKVTLCSITSSSVLMTSQFVDLNDDEILNLLAYTANANGIDSAENPLLVETYKQLRRKKRNNKKELILFNQINSMIKKSRHHLNDMAEKMIVDANAEGLASAINSGLVELKYLDVASKTLGKDYYNLIAETIISGESYPLLDSITSNLINIAIKEGEIVPLGVSVTKAKQVGLSSDLFNRLPSFDTATMDEIIDIRKELEKPLIRFRSAIIGFSREVENAPWQKGFLSEVEQVYLEEVEPAILDIEDAYKSNKLLFSLVEKVSEKPFLLPSSSALGLLISQASQLPDIVSQTLAVSAGAAVIGLDAIKEWREQQKEIQRNQLFFYYQAGKQLV